MAQGTTEHIDATTAAVFIPTLYAVPVIVQREQALVFGGLVDRKFEAGAKHGGTINVRSITNLTVVSKGTSANAATQFETQTEVNVSITIGTWEYAAITVEDFIEVQSDHDLMKEYTGKLGYALGLAVDDALAALPDDLGNALGALGTPMSYDDYVRAIQYMDDENVPQESRAFVIAPAERSGLLKMDQYIHNDYSTLHGEGPRGTMLEKAYIKSFLGVPVYVTTNVEGSNAAGHDNVLMHKECFALVMQLKPKVRLMADANYLADKIVVENIYGVAEMRDSATYGRYGVFCRGA